MKPEIAEILGWDPVIRADFISIFLGSLIDTGLSRTVYGCRMDNSLVIKIEQDDYYKQNVAEWLIWDHVAHNEKYSRWFAPCEWLSPNGRVLLQKRTFPIETLPKRLPPYLGDQKPENFGLYKGRVVCHDYGMLWGILTCAFK